MSVLYTPGQLRGAISIKSETYRHWKKSLSPLCKGTGHSPCFTSGDILAVAVVRCLTNDLGIKISALSSLAEDLFEICNSESWPVLERSKLAIDIVGNEIILSGEFKETLVVKPVIYVPLQVLIAQLRDRFLASAGTTGQAELRFPLTPVGSATNQSGGRS
ncbi:hypothetical protein SAMN04515647_1206 [Cohaesibacter sp. ES.047]|uniref:hypothetical protein n=1 Tax=Cohaesibacter sp. ES.047 TaxID=1798205 RepID=UPI000BC04CFF|nr:hypothetical protein [Cohaesibacter sp. ES.047]SNY91012.1 hypothetical protein SAMN04515647_1206 [Cohaesibacter sp. ES.047]